MKKNIKVILLILLFAVLLGSYLGYKKYNISKTQSLNKETAIKSKENENSKNLSHEKIKKQALDALSKAEKSKSKTDINEAKKLIEILPLSDDKETLNKKLDSLMVDSGQLKKSSVTWTKTPEYNGIKTLISGSVDNKKVKIIKAFVDNKEIEVKLNSDGTFIINCDNVNAGNIVNIKAYDENSIEVLSREVTRLL